MNEKTIPDFYARGRTRKGSNAVPRQGVITAFSLVAGSTAAFLLLARGQMSNRKFNLSVGALPPIFNNWNETALRKLMDDLAGFATSRVNRQRKYL